MIKKIRWMILAPFALSSLFAAEGVDKIDFETDIKPILEFNCVSCHHEGKIKGDLRMETLEWVMKSKDVIIPGDPEGSSFWWMCTLEPDDEDVMPPVKKPERDYPMPKVETERLKQWISQGAAWPKTHVLVPRKRLPQTIDFVKEVQPILEYKCVVCHNAEKKEGKLRLDSKKYAFEKEEVLTPGKPYDSSFWWLCTLPADDEEVMPPDPEPLLEARELAVLRRWIEQGANWPDGLEPLIQKKKKNMAAGTASIDLYHQLGFKPGPVEDPLEAYEQEIRGVGATIQMVPIKGGTFQMGSPAGEVGRKEDEGPVFETEVASFWMADKEVTWDLYENWMIDVERENRAFNKLEANERDVIADGVTRPTPPYADMTFGMGKEGYPAICMTQLAAKVFCMWLSAKTGHFYRLPTEAEWEYAYRAGTKTAYFWGDDPKGYEDYGWGEDNSDWQYQPVGKLKPNPWGLYDIAGNVWEWTLDGLGSYAPYAGDPVEKNLVKTTTNLYPRTVRGGSWDDPAAEMRGASRFGSEKRWKKQDPQIPKSVWYHTDALWVGFRVVRAKEIPTAEDLRLYWPTEEDLTGIPGR
jgi:formylglycine-generating enzyme required for sulfatase activity